MGTDKRGERDYRLDYSLPSRPMKQNQTKPFSPTGVLLLGALLTSLACVFFGFYVNLKAEKHGMSIKMAAKKLDAQEWGKVAEDLHQILRKGNLNQTVPPPPSVTQIGFQKGVICDGNIFFHHGGGFVENTCYLNYFPPEPSRDSQLGKLTFNGQMVYPASPETSP